MERGEGGRIQAGWLRVHAAADLQSDRRDRRSQVELSAAHRHTQLVTKLIFHKKSSEDVLLQMTRRQ